MPQLLYLFVLSCLLDASTSFAAQPFVVSHLGYSDANDTRADYSKALIQLAFEKTREEYGDYRFEQTPPILGNKRVFWALKEKTYPNLLVGLPFSDAIEDASELTFINIPADLGLLSYRICFVNAAAKEKVKQAKSLADLRQFSIIQGGDWPDVQVLRHNGFNVLTNDAYSNLFKMVVGGRADLFCRAINELMTEYNTFHNIGNLVYDQSFALVYPHTWVYYFNKSNVLLGERMEKGLKQAYADGSMQKLLLKYYAESIRFANLKNRKIYYLETPLYKRISPDFAHYSFDPLLPEYRAN